MLPFNRSWIHQLDRGRVTVRRSSGTITPYLVAQRCRTVLKGGTYGLFCRPKVPCDTQRRHLRLILSPKGAVRHSKAALTAYSVAQRCHATLKGGTYGDFSSPESTATNYPVSKMRRSAHENDSEDSPVSRTRRFAHEATLEDPFVSRTRCFAHETSLADTPVSRSRRLAHETTLADPPVSRSRRLAHETTSADPSVSRTRRLAHETTSADPSVSRTRLFTHETTSELSCATGTLRALLNAAEVRPEPVRLIERLGAFRDGDLDG